jgi:hypothetical protein
MVNARIRANVKWFSTRMKPRGKAKRTKASPRQKAAFRLTELANLYRHRCGITLPDDDAGLEYLEIAINHLGNLPRPQHAINCWIEIWTPWLTVGDKAKIVTPILMNPRVWSADEMAHELGLKMEERTMLGITTIGAIDMNKAARTKLRKQRAAARKQKLRANSGAKPRQIYESESISRAKPWLDQGISRATWYRRNRETGLVAETSPATA